MFIPNSSKRPFVPSEDEASPPQKRQKIDMMPDEMGLDVIPSRDSLSMQIDPLTKRAFGDLIQSQEKAHQAYVLALVANEEGGFHYIDAIQLQKDGNLHPITKTKIQQVYYCALAPRGKELDYLGCYRKGAMDKSENHLLKAVAGGKISAGDAYYQRGDVHFKGVEREVDFEKAVCFFTDASKYNHLPAKYMLAKCKREGLGTEIDPEQEAKLHYDILKNVRATTKTTLLPQQFVQQIIADAEKEDPFAQCIYGIILQIGCGMKPDAEAGFDIFSKLAERGYVPGLHCKASCLLKGIGIEKDIIAAKKLLTCAAEQNYLDSQTMLGVGLLFGLFGEKDLPEGLRLIKLAAEQGHVKARVALAQHMMAGIGLPRDPEAAFKMLTSAESDDHEWQYMMGNCYAKGSGTLTDHAKAIEFYTLSAQQGYHVAQRALGLCFFEGTGVPKNQQAAVEQFSKAARMGDAAAIYLLSYCLQEGCGIKKNPFAAVKGYRSAADKGYPPAQFNLGLCCLKQEGGPADLNEALKLFSSAAKAGFPAALYQLALYKEDIDKDFIGAAKGYATAAEKQYTLAYSALGRCYELGIGLKVDFEAAVRNYRLGAEMHCPIAQRQLALCLLNGTGTPKAAEAAVKLFSEAGAQRDRTALNELGYCFQHGIGTPVDHEAAINAYKKASDEYLFWNPTFPLQPGVGIGIPVHPLTLLNPYLETNERALAEAKLNLGFCKLMKAGRDGLGGEEEAVRLFSAAAKAGLVAAQYNLALCHEYGWGTSVDLPTAKMLYQMAAQYNHTAAMLKLKEPQFN